MTHDKGRLQLHSSHDDDRAEFAAPEQVFGLVAPSLVSGPTFVGTVFDSGPNEASEIAFLNGLDATNHVAATSFGTWNGATKAKYGSQSDSAKWGSGTPGTAGGTVDFFFQSSSHFTSTEKTVIESALSLWSAVANISFQLVTSSSQAQLTFVRGSDGGAYEQDNSLTGPAGAGQVGSATMLSRMSASISIDTSVPGFGPIDGSFTAFGGYVYDTIVHEIGHAMGLGHGGPYNGDVYALKQQYSAYDTRLWSIMSYIDPSQSAKYSASYPVHATWGTSSDGYPDEPTTMMMLDILAVQQDYGLPTTSPFSGGQIYGFHTNIASSVRSFYDFTVNTNPIVTIWNDGSNNTLDLSGYSTAATVDLHAGTFSSCDGMTDNICIADSTAIDKYVGSSGVDTVTANGDADTISTGNGDDVIIFAGTFTADDRVDGGAGSDTLDLSGKTSVKFGASTLVNVETIDLAGGAKYKLTTNDAMVPAGQTLKIDGTALTASDTLTFNGAKEIDGKFDILGGAGNDVLTGGAGNDTIDAGLGSNTVTGGAGSDTITVGSGTDTLVYTGKAQSTGVTFDIVNAFDFASNDHFDVTSAVTGIDSEVTSGQLRTASFDSDLGAAISAAHLGAGHAVLFTPNSGNYNGDTFLIIDNNGTAGYQAGADIVIRLAGALHLTSISTADFV